MSSDPIRDVSAREAWRAVQQSGAGGDGQGFGTGTGHPDQIEDIVAIEANVEILERLRDSRNTQDVIALLPGEEQQQKAQREIEEIVEYVKLPGERVDESYKFEAAREAMFELIVKTKGDLSDHDMSLVTFSSLFAQKVREKEQDPTNRPDIQGESEIKINSDED